MFRRKKNLFFAVIAAISLASGLTEVQAMKKQQKRKRDHQTAQAIFLAKAQQLKEKLEAELCKGHVSSKIQKRINGFKKELLNVNLPENREKQAIEEELAKIDAMLMPSDDADFSDVDSDSDIDSDDENSENSDNKQPLVNKKKSKKNSPHVPPVPLFQPSVPASKNRSPIKNTGQKEESREKRIEKNDKQRKAERDEKVQATREQKTEQKHVDPIAPAPAAQSEQTAQPQPIAPITQNLENSQNSSLPIPSATIDQKPAQGETKHPAPLVQENKQEQQDNKQEQVIQPDSITKKFVKLFLNFNIELALINKVIDNPLMQKIQLSQALQALKTKFNSMTPENQRNALIAIRCLEIAGIGYATYLFYNYLFGAEAVQTLTTPKQCYAEAALEAKRIEAVREVVREASSHTAAPQADLVQWSQAQQSAQPLSLPAPEPITYQCYADEPVSQWFDNPEAAAEAALEVKRVEAVQEVLREASSHTAAPQADLVRWTKPTLSLPAPAPTPVNPPEIPVIPPTPPLETKIFFNTSNYQCLQSDAPVVPSVSKIPVAPTTVPAPNITIEEPVCLLPETPVAEASSSEAPTCSVESLFARFLNNVADQIPSNIQTMMASIGRALRIRTYLENN